MEWGEVKTSEIKLEESKEVEQVGSTGLDLTGFQSAEF